jgi:pimeloyl-ACP methyl ester carboxylesterase
VHGFPDSAHSWRYVGPRLAAKGFRVVAPFTRGYEPTGLAPDGDYHLGALMSDLVDLHRELGGGADSVLIGHDWGSFTTNGLAAYPGSPFGAHIAMAIPPVASFDNRQRGIAQNLRLLAGQFRRSWYILFFQLPFLPERLLHKIIPRLWKDWSPKGADLVDDVQATLAALPTLENRRAAVAYYRALVRFTRTSTPYVGLHRYRLKLPVHPVLVLHGEDDGALHVDYTDGVIAALPPGSRLERIARAGHFLQVDEPAAVFDAICRYLGVASTMRNDDTVSR